MKGRNCMSKRLHAPRVRIEVSEEIIDSAERRNSGHCMIADAIKASMPDVRMISVDLQTIRWSDHKAGRRFTYLTPRQAQVALVKFDQGLHTEPFAFSVRSGQSMPINEKKGHERAAMKIEPGGNAGTVPVKVGGQRAPTAALAHTPRGQRRAFGLRALEL
jgi:hypothetical protein